MMTSTTVKPTHKTLTFAEYVQYQGEPGILYELHRGKLIPMPTPTGLHTKICQFIIYQLQQYFASQGLPLVVINATGVRIEEDTSRIPDIVVCTETLWKQICDRGGSAIFDFGEQPSLVVEVTSQNWRDDYILKRAEYAMVEIPEYWLIDPNKRKIRVCSHPENEDGYQHEEFLGGQLFSSVQFPDFQVPVDLILSPPVVETLIKQDQESRQQLEQRLNEAEERAELERQRAERLAQRLRELNIDPDAL